MKLWNNIAALQIAAVVSTVILTIGAVIEYWANLRLLALLSLKWLLRKSNPFERCAFGKLLLHTIGPILVVLGIAGEVVFEGRDFVLEDEQGEQSQQTIATLQKQASASNKEAGELRKEAEDEHMARVELEDRVSWRRLSTNNKDELKGKMLGFKGMFAEVHCLEHDMEGCSFGADIANSLRQAKLNAFVNSLMTVNIVPQLNNPITGFPNDVIIETTNDPKGFAAGKVVHDTLKSFGFGPIKPPTLHKFPPGIKALSPMIWVSIYGRPEGPQGDAKLRADAK